MKNKALIASIIILIIVTAIIAVSVSYAFFSVGNSEFSLEISSATSAEIALTLEMSNTTLTPNSTHSGVGNYTKSSVVNDEKYAVYAIKYNCLSKVNVGWYVTETSYIDGDNNSLSEGKSTYLDKHLNYSFIRVDSYDVSSLPEATSWVKKGTTYTINDTPQGEGYMLVYVKFDVSQELVPEFFDDVKISFTIATEIENTQS